MLLLITATAIAQTSTSRITGTASDASGAVPGATVTIKNEATGATATQTTTDSGLFVFSSLPVGSYAITIERTGYKSYQSTGNRLEVGTPLNLDALLEAGQVTEVVNVQAGSEQLQTSTATIGNVVQRKAIEALPLNGRNPLTLITLEPGVVQRSAGAAGSGVHVNGSRDRAFNVTIDGIDANESSVPNPVSNIYRLTPDNVQEYKVTTNNATAEEGRNSGASVSVATRSGTNDFHGTAFYFLRNDALNANEFFSNAQGVAKPAIKLNQYGFEFNGPIKKNKTFFFGSIQRTRINFTTPIDQAFSSGVPIVFTPSALAGNYRFFRADPTTPFTLNGQTITRNTQLLVDRNTGALLPGVRTCATNSDTNCVATYNIFANAGTGLNSAVGALLNSYPAPNSYGFGDGLNTAGYVFNTPASHKGPAYMARVDHNFDTNNSVFARFLQSDYNTLGGDPLNGRGQVFPGFPPLGEVFRASKNLAISYRRVVSPRIVNEFTTGFARFVFLFTQGEANPAFPNVPPFDFASISEPFNNTPRTQRAISTPQFLDNVSIVSGAHLFRTGVNVRFYRHVDRRGQPGGVNLTPNIRFDGGLRQQNLPNLPAIASSTRAGINSTDNTSFFGIVNTLLGTPTSISQTFIGDINGNGFLPFRTGDAVTLFAEKHILNQYNFYAQDEWKVRPNVTLDYGVRWEINPAPTTAGAGRVYVPSTPIAGTPGPANPVVGQPGPVTFVEAKHWFNRDNLGAIGPRVGLAYSPDWKSGFMNRIFGKNGQSVIRLGYGLSFDTVSSFQVTAVAGRVPGLLTTCTQSLPSSSTSGSLTPGCASIPDLTARAGQGFPEQLPVPTGIRPASFLTPPLQLLGSAPVITVFDPNLKLPTVHQWSLSVQRELPLGFVAQAAYIGRRGERLFRAYDINQISADPILPSFIIMQQNRARGCNPDGTGTGCVGGVAPPILSVPGITSTFLNSSTTIGELGLNSAGSFAGRIEGQTLALKLRPNQQFGTITYIDSGGDSNYHAAQFTLRRRFSSGLGMNMAYTYGKSIDNQSVDPVGAASGGGLSTTNSRTPTDARNFRNERARSDFDRRQVLTVASVYELPVGRGQRFLNSSNSILNGMLGGWSVNGIYTYLSGEPFAVRSGVRTANNSHESRADVIAPVSVRLQQLPNVVGPVVFADASAFAIPAPGSNGSGRNIFTAPSYWNLDLGFVKRLNITERVNLQFRTEMFNAFNHPNFDNPRDASVGSPSIRSSVFAQTCCTTVAPPSSQTVIQTGESARVIQFALKLQF
ncbi:MAG: carboxypeptidase regulatory-like domain-containing protein [Pyrinomonadaceae bacterium]